MRIGAATTFALLAFAATANAQTELRQTDWSGGPSDLVADSLDGATGFVSTSGHMLTDTAGTLRAAQFLLTHRGETYEMPNTRSPAGRRSS